MQFAGVGASGSRDDALRIPPSSSSKALESGAVALDDTAFDGFGPVGCGLGAVILSCAPIGQNVPAAGAFSVAKAAVSLARGSGVIPRVAGWSTRAAACLSDAGANASATAALNATVVLATKNARETARLRFTSAPARQRLARSSSF